MVFHKETDLRRWFKRQFPQQVFWIENRIGGSFGFPDALLGYRQRLIPFEFKLGRKKENGLWVFDLRPSQYEKIRNLSNLDIQVFILIANKNNKEIGLISSYNLDLYKSGPIVVGLYTINDGQSILHYINSHKSIKS